MTRALFDLNPPLADKCQVLELEVKRNDLVDATYTQNHVFDRRIKRDEIQDAVLSSVTNALSYGHQPVNRGLESCHICRDTIVEVRFGLVIIVCKILRSARLLRHRLGPKIHLRCSRPKTLFRFVFARIIVIIVGLYIMAFVDHLSALACFEDHVESLTVFIPINCGIVVNLEARNIGTHPLLAFKLILQAVLIRSNFLRVEIDAASRVKPHKFNSVFSFGHLAKVEHHAEVVINSTFFSVAIVL